MPAYFEYGYSVNEVPWHGMGFVPDRAPRDKQEAMEWAGHDWDLIECAEVRVGIENAVLDAAGQTFDPTRSGVLRKAEGFKAFLRSDTLDLLHVSRDSYAGIPNSVAYELAETLFDQGFKYETGVTLDGGRLCALTVRLDEPIHVPGDDSVILPFGVVSWGHAANAALRADTGTIRVVCANTEKASEMEAKGRGTSFTFRHTANWRERVNEAKAVLAGARASLDIYAELARELSSIAVTPEQRDLFVSTIIGDKPEERAARSPRVESNLSTERAKINALFMGPTIPDAHKLTGYGLWLAGGEYFDHKRAFRSHDSYVKRTLLSEQSAKASLAGTIRELAAA